MSTLIGNANHLFVRETKYVSKIYQITTDWFRCFIYVCMINKFIDENEKKVSSIDVLQQWIIYVNGSRTTAIGRK